MLIICNYLYSQTSYDKYNWLIYAGMIEKKKEDFDKARFYFEKAFKYKEPQGSTDMLNYAAVVVKLNRKKKAIDCIKKSIVQYAAPKEYILSFGEFKELESNSAYKKIINNYDYYENEYYRNLKNPSIYYSVEELTTKDRLVREIGSYVKKDDYFIDKSKKIDYEFDIIRVQDSLNINEFISISKKFGYQSRGWILLWHHRGDEYATNNYVWQFFKPLIKKEIEKGNIERSFFAQFEDEAAINYESSGQIYGTFQNRVIKDIQDVDKRRIEVSLPPLYYDYLIYENALPENYKIDEKKFYQTIYNKVKDL